MTDEQYIKRKLRRKILKQKTRDEIRTENIKIENNLLNNILLIYDGEQENKPDIEFIKCFLGCFHRKKVYFSDKYYNICKMKKHSDIINVDKTLKDDIINVENNFYYMDEQILKNLFNALGCIDIKTLNKNLKTLFIKKRRQ